MFTCQYHYYVILDFRWSDESVSFTIIGNFFMFEHNF